MITKYSQEICRKYTRAVGSDTKIKEAGLQINPEKYHLIKTEVKYLRCIIDKNGVRTNPSKIEAVYFFNRPKCVKNLTRKRILRYEERIIGNLLLLLLL